MAQAGRHVQWSGSYGLVSAASAGWPSMPSSHRLACTAARLGPPLQHPLARPCNTPSAKRRAAASAPGARAAAVPLPAPSPRPAPTAWPAQAVACCPTAAPAAAAAPRHCPAQARRCRCFSWAASRWCPPCSTALSLPSTPAWRRLWCRPRRLQHLRRLEAAAAAAGRRRGASRCCPWRSGCPARSPARSRSSRTRRCARVGACACAKGRAGHCGLRRDAGGLGSQSPGLESFARQS